MNNFSKFSLEAGGSIHPLLIPSELTNGTGLMNPSIFLLDDKILVNLRHVNYTFYHSEDKLFQHQYGPLTYVHPEQDMHLRTTNYYCELDKSFNIVRFNKIDTSSFDNYEPLWDFVGLEDARIFVWDHKLYVSGVRRDTTTNGQGRMELSEIVVDQDSVKEISRFRIPTPKDPNSYCEKNWMPILDLPYHYIKWSNPTEVVKINRENKTCETVYLGDRTSLQYDLRGGSQVISWKDYYLAVVHEVDLFSSEVGRKDAIYRHRFILWDKNFNIVKYSEDFDFMHAHVEFCVGLAKSGDDFLMTFGFQDNAAYLLKVPENVVEKFIFGEKNNIAGGTSILKTKEKDFVCEEKPNDFRSLLNSYVNDPQNPDNNFIFGLFYEDKGQTASALSYYLRSAERSNNSMFKYEALLRAATCFEKQGARNFTVKGLLQHAVAIQPQRPEAYYLLSRFYEKEKKDGSWQDSYMISSLGNSIANISCSPLKTKTSYPGEYGLLFQKAVSGWWCGLCNESRELFKLILKNHKPDAEHLKSILNNLQFLKSLSFDNYDVGKKDRLKIKFLGCEKIERNYSEAYQDMFVLTMLNGKTNGTYLEIGAGQPFYGSNTALLEKQFNWSGVSIDVDEKFVASHKNERKNLCLLKDGTNINYSNFLSGLDFPKNIDYLQIDCDPPDVSYKILLTIPFEEYKFAVVTYEHDYYRDDKKIYQEKARKYLESYGYTRVVNNISPDEFRSYEDWWIHPALVDEQIFLKMKNLDDSIKKAENYILS